MLKLGSLKLAGRVILSPMEAVSDCAFRRQAYLGGASFTWTEMIRAAAVCKNNLATLELIDTYDEETPTGIQLLVRGQDETIRCLHKLESFASGESKKFIEHKHEDGTISREERSFKHFKNIRAVDINLGCPSPAVIEEGAGPALLKRSKKLREIFESLVSWKENNSLGNVGAVGCKIRLGLNQVEQSNKVYMQVVEIARDCGLDYITVHARHALQKSRDPPTIACISNIVKAAQHMPVIGNGDVFTDFAALQMMQSTGCHGVMVARAAIRNPWASATINQAISQSNASLPLSEYSDNQVEFDKKTWPTLEEINVAEKEYLNLVAKYKTKEKFTKFHQSNFERMRQCIIKNDFTLKVYSPRTVHLS